MSHLSLHQTYTLEAFFHFRSIRRENNLTRVTRRIKLDYSPSSIHVALLTCFRGMNREKKKVNLRQPCVQNICEKKTIALTEKTRGGSEGRKRQTMHEREMHVARLANDHNRQWTVGNGKLF